MIWPFRREAEPDSDPIAAASTPRRSSGRRGGCGSGSGPGRSSLLAGAYLGARPGVGLTFAELRAYEPGDDVRHLDWNVTARQGRAVRPPVRRGAGADALADRRRLGQPPVRPRGPDQGRPRGAGRGAAGDGGDPERRPRRPGAGQRPRRGRAPPGGGDRHLARLVRALVATPAVSRRTDLTVGLGRLRRSARRALVVVLSDFLDDGRHPCRRASGGGRRGGTRWSRSGSSSPARRRSPTPGCSTWRRRARDAADRRFGLAAGPRRLRPRGRRAPCGLSPLVRRRGDRRVRDLDRRRPDRPLIRIFDGRAARRGRP